MPAFTLNSLKKGIYPWPVYEAHFSDGTVSRMSFWCRADKPIDFAHGRRLSDLCGRHVPENKVAQYLAANRPPRAMLAGFVCLPDGRRIQDPMTANKIVRMPLPNAKKAAALALAMLQAGDVDGAAAALRAIAA